MSILARVIISGGLSFKEGRGAVLNSAEEFVISTGLYPDFPMLPAKSSAYGRSGDITGQDPEKSGPVFVS